MLICILKQLHAKRNAGAQMCPTNYAKVLLQWIEPENLPEYLGGTSKATLLDDAGPWQDPKIVAEVSPRLLIPSMIPRHLERPQKTNSSSPDTPQM